MVIRLAGFRLLWQIMDIRYSVRRNTHIVHRHTLEIADTETDGAVKHERILGLFQRIWYFGRHYFLQFLFTQENRVIVRGLHHNLAPFGTKFPERRFAYFVFVLQLGKEGAQELHFPHNRIAFTPFCGDITTLHILIDCRILIHILVFFEKENAVVHQHIGSKILERQRAFPMNAQIPGHFADGAAIVLETA